METLKKNPTVKKEAQKKEKIDKASVPFQSELYKGNPSDPKENKKFRSKMRNRRNRLIRSIMKSNEDKDTQKRNELIKEFNSFYKENYIKNDYTLESILGQSSSIEIREEVGDFLNHLKKWKVKLS